MQIAPLGMTSGLEQAGNNTYDSARTAAESAKFADVLKDSGGNAAGVVIVNRNGRQAIRAKTIVDTTDRHHIARLAGTKFTEFKKEFYGKYYGSAEQ